MAGTRKPIKHGTIGGYMAHYRRDGAGSACNSCLIAWRVYAQQRDGKVARRVWLARKAGERARAATKAAHHKRDHDARKKKNADRRAAREAAARDLALRSATEENT